MDKELTVVDGISLKNEIDKLEEELAHKKEMYEFFKAEFMRQLKSADLEGVKKGGYNFVIVKPKRKIVHHLNAKVELENIGKLNEFMTLDEKRFIAFFPESTAISTIDGKEYLKITELKKE